MFLKYHAHFCVFHFRNLDRMFLEYFKNNLVFYFIIALRSAYIERYLRGKLEFQTHISPITDGFGSLFSHSFTTTNTLATPPSPTTIRNNLPRCPSPLMRDVGPITRPSLTSEVRLHRSCPSPFQRDVGGLLPFDGGLG